MGMNSDLGQALCDFDTSLSHFRTRLEPFPDLLELVFQDTEEWHKLLRHKLLPHLAGEGCLVVAVAGGTNTGKSTVFNMLLGANVSPVRDTAAATCRPLVVGNALRAAQCLEGRLLPEFQPIALDEAEALVSADAPPDALYVARNDSLPDHLVLLDIPDVDSIEKQHWDVAESIQAAGDVVIAVLTGEKYKDERVVGFFRRARAAGRVILPLMNKANPLDGYASARRHLDAFCADVGLENPVCFAVPHDFTLVEDFQRPIEALDGGPALRAYIEALDVAPIKKQVFHDTVLHFVALSAQFLARVRDTGASLRGIACEFEDRAEACSLRYDPEPGESVGKLVHQFIQSKRGALSRVIAWAGGFTGHYLSPLGKAITAALRRRAMLETPVTQNDVVIAHHRQTLEQLTRGLITEYLQHARNVREPASRLILEGLEPLDDAAVVRMVADLSLGMENISVAFRDHARRKIEEYWEADPVLRRFLLELDALLIVAPTAVAVPLAYFTGGIGVPEVLAAAGPLAGAFFAQVMEHQIGDKWFDLIGPWRRDQQQVFRQALLHHLTRPGLCNLEEILKLLEGESYQSMRSHHESCLIAS